MNGSDMQRVVGRWTAGKATRDSLAGLHRQQQATPPGTAEELLRHSRAEAATRPDEERLPPKPARRAVLR